MREDDATILVTGDVFVDWSIVVPSDADEDILDLAWLVRADDAVHAAAMPGGAARAAQLVSASAVGLTGGRTVKVIGPDLPAAALFSPFDDRVTRSFSLVTQFPRSLTNRSATVWRVDRAWGLQSAQHPDAFLPEVGARTIDVLAIQDIGLAYRRAPEIWYQTRNELPRHIIVSTMTPLAGNALVDDLLARAPDRLTIIVSSTDLRQAGANIGYPLSWERTAEEVDNAVRRHPIGQASRVIVMLELSGAIIVRRDNPTTLVFDPAASEGSWRRQHPGQMVGYPLCYLAALAVESAAREASGRDTEAVRRAVAASRALHRSGLIRTLRPSGDTLEFPADAVAEALTREPTDIIATYHPRADGERSIVAGTLGHDSVLHTAEQLAMGGPSRLPVGIPVETVGAWSSVDRTEIETLRSVGHVIDEYTARYRSAQPLGRPLSVAVFGAPGAGKSFAVKETIRHKLPGGTRILEFNLSQFDDPSGLAAAFHQIRDAVLEQRLPLVFWDEFDTPLDGRRLGWLRHFLAPMQDGRFREGDEFRPLGPAIFVFAGGTASSFKEFTEVRAAEEESAAKKPDFISRLRGYVDILGPNPKSSDDDAVALRRALLLRSLLMRKAPQMAEGSGPAATLRIDRGLLRAFLLIGAYKHGARSMEAIIDMSAVSGRLQYEPASLPAPHLLDLHVDSAEFLELAGD